jgi:acetyl esterase
MAVVFVEYSRAPEAKYPVQIEQCYAAAQWITEQGAGGGFDITRIAVAGDSAGGNVSTVLTLMAKQRGSVQFAHQCPTASFRHGVVDIRDYRPWPRF